MMNFYSWLNEISSVGSNFNLPIYTSRRPSKISPDINKFNIIPIKLGNDIYKIFKKYSVGDDRFIDCNNLLDRRGDGQGVKKTLASNGEIYNLRELANYIIKISKDPKESEVAEATLKTIAELEQNLATKT